MESEGVEVDVAGRIVEVAPNGVRLGARVAAIVRIGACVAVGVDCGERYPQATNRAINTIQKYRRGDTFVVIEISLHQHISLKALRQLIKRQFWLDVPHLRRKELIANTLSSVIASEAKQSHRQLVI